MEMPGDVIDFFRSLHRRPGWWASYLDPLFMRASATEMLHESLAVVLAPPPPAYECQPGQVRARETTVSLRIAEPQTISQTLDLIELKCTRSTRWRVPEGDLRAEDERLVARVRKDVVREIAPIFTQYGRDVIMAVIEALSGPPTWGRADTSEIDLRRFVEHGLGRHARPKTLRDALTVLRELSRWMLTIKYRSPRHYEQGDDCEIVLNGHPLVEVIQEHHSRRPGRIAIGEQIPTSITVRMSYYLSPRRWYVLVPRSSLTASLMLDQLTSDQVAAARARSARRGTRLARVDLLDDYLRWRIRHGHRSEVWVTELDLARACGIPDTQPRKRRWMVRKLIREAVEASLVELLSERRESRRIEGESVVEHLLRPTDRAISGRDIHDQARESLKNRRRNSAKNKRKRTESTMLGTLFSNVGNAIRQCWERPLPKSACTLGSLRDSADARIIRSITEYWDATPTRRASQYSVDFWGGSPSWAGSLAAAAVGVAS
jgi:hypothetical protein